LQVGCPDEVKYDVVDRLTKEFQEDGYDVIDINGARVNFGDGWGLVRASSNLPVLVLRFEAKTEERVKELEALFREKFAKYPVIGSEWESG
jgi:phosphomannomutase/phosphoglucomutase